MTTQVAGAAIVRDGRLLAARRTHPDDVAGGWELPGGKVDPGETPEQAVSREIEEELGCRIEVLRRLAGCTPIKPGYELTAYLVRLVAGEPVPLEHDATRWLGPEELTSVDWLPSDRPFLGELRKLLLDGSRLPGGNVGGAVRIGPTVRRATGPWTPTIHAVLAELHRIGLRDVPEVFGFDERGREALGYLPGRVLDLDVETPSAGLLADAMHWLRRFHDLVSPETVAELTRSGRWRFSVRDPYGVGEPAEVLCHNDFAPYNVALSTSVDGDRVVGVFDWDLAAPGTRIQDLAFAAWNWVPMWRPTTPPEEAAERLEVMARAYGDVRAAQILAGVGPRIEETLELIRRGQTAGDAGMAKLALIGEPERTDAALAGLRLRVPDIELALRR